MTASGSAATTDCVCGHRRSHHGRRCCAQHDHCQWDGCGCPHYAQAVERDDEAEAEKRARRKALTEAWQAVDRAIRPLGYGGGASNSPWNQGYEQAKNKALNAILALRDEATT